MTKLKLVKPCVLSLRSSCVVAVLLHRVRRLFILMVMVFLDVFHKKQHISKKSKKGVGIFPQCTAVSPSSSFPTMSVDRNKAAKKTTFLDRTDSFRLTEVSPL